MCSMNHPIGGAKRRLSDKVVHIVVALRLAQEFHFSVAAAAKPENAEWAVASRPLTNQQKGRSRMKKKRTRKTNKDHKVWRNPPFPQSDLGELLAIAPKGSFVVLITDGLREIKHNVWPDSFGPTGKDGT